MKKAIAVAIVSIALIGCQDLQQPVVQPNFRISDAVHSNPDETSNEFFYFLAPLVTQPEEFNGTFNPDLDPIVEIFDIDLPSNGVFSDPHDLAPLGCADPNWQRVERLVPAASEMAYGVGWDTHATQTVAGKIYRICVVVELPADTVVLGYRDVSPTNSLLDVAGSPEELSIMPFLNNSTIDINFWVGKKAVLCEEEGVLDCTVTVLPPEGGTAVCDEGTCGFSIPAGAVAAETPFLVQNVACPFLAGSNPQTDGRVDYLDIDIPQYGVCLEVIPLVAGAWEGLLQEGVAGACIFAPGLEGTPQHDRLQLHAQNPDGTVDALPSRSTDFLDCDGYQPPLLAAIPSAMGRMEYFARRGLQKTLRTLGDVFGPEPLVAAHSGFGGGTVLKCTTSRPSTAAGNDGPSAAAAATCTSSSNASGFSGARAQAAGEVNAIHRMAWALPSQVSEKLMVDAGGNVLGPWVDPVVGGAGNTVFPAVRVFDEPQFEADGVTLDGPQLPVRGAFVTFDVLQGDPLPGGPTVVETGANGLAFVPWVLGPAGDLELEARGLGIGVDPVLDPLGTGPFADHRTNVVRLETGAVSFGASICGSGAMVDGMLDQSYTLIGETVGQGGRGGIPIEFYYTVDCENIYFVVRIKSEAKNIRSVRLEFDNDNDGVAEAGDDVLSMRRWHRWRPWRFSDRHLTRWCARRNGRWDCSRQDRSAQGSGVVGFDENGGWSVFELAHPLASGDTRGDFQLNPGDSVGFWAAVSVGRGPHANTTYPGVRTFKPLVIEP